MGALRKIVAVAGVGLALLAAGCGNVLTFIPEDCILFSRTEARSWHAIAVAGRADGESELEALATVLLECVQSNCDGQSGGVCAVSCAACTDALVEIAYE
jgi:hypothetical protein